MVCLSNANFTNFLIFSFCFSETYFKDSPDGRSLTPRGPWLMHRVPFRDGGQPLRGRCSFELLHDLWRGAPGLVLRGGLPQGHKEDLQRCSRRGSGDAPPCNPLKRGDSKKSVSEHFCEKRTFNSFKRFSKENKFKS